MTLTKITSGQCTVEDWEVYREPARGALRPGERRDRRTGDDDDTVTHDAADDDEGG